MSMEPATAELPSAADLAAQLGPVPADDAPLAEPGERGVTTLADRVVEKVVAGAVEELELTADTPHRLRSDTRARTRVDVDGQVATIRIDMAVLYPSPIRAVARVTRDHVTSRVCELTGLEVKQVDINVVAFPLAATGGRRVR